MRIRNERIDVCVAACSRTTGVILAAVLVQSDAAARI
jgi:hypothetical protein